MASHFSNFEKYYRPVNYWVLLLGVTAFQGLDRKVKRISKIFKDGIFRSVEIQFRKGWSRVGWKTGSRRVGVGSGEWGVNTNTTSRNCIKTSYNESKLYYSKSQRVKIALQQVTTSQKRVQRVRIITTSQSYKLTNAE